MFSDNKNTAFLFIFLYSGLLHAMQGPIGQPILVVNSAAEFVRAVRLEQEGWLFDYIKGACGCLFARGFCQVGVEEIPNNCFTMALAESAPGILRSTLSCAAATGLAYWGYKAFTRSKDYDAARRVAQLTCPQCLREKVLGDQNAEAVLGANIYRAILDALSAPTHAGLCMAHRPQQQMVY